MIKKADDRAVAPGAFLVPAECDDCGFTGVARPGVRKCGNCGAWVGVSQVVLDD